MKRKILLFSTLTLIIAGGIFWSCQKDETPSGSDEGLILKSATNCNECVTNWIDSKETETIGTNLYVDKWNDNLNAYFRIYRLAGATIGNVTFDNGSNIGFSPAVTEYLITKPVTVIACTKISTLFNRIGGVGGAGGTLENITVDYYLRELCIGCDEDFSYVDNMDGTITFTYLPAESGNKFVEFTFPQAIVTDAPAGFTQPGNGNVRQKYVDFVACTSVSWTFDFSANCTGTGQTLANVFTDFKVDGVSKKSDVSNIQFVCP